MDQKSRNIYSYNGKLYEFPTELNERFEYLTRKMEYAKQNPEYIELYRGTTIVFNGEFNEYERQS